MAKLKKEKKPKKLKAKKPPKQKKQKQPKPPKQKKTKNKKAASEEDGGGKKSKKKIVLILIIMVLLTSAAIGFFIVKNKGKNIVVEAYTIGEDSVSSITTVVGERKMKETVVYELDGITKQEYIYKKDKDTETDLETYETYLLDEADFIEIEPDEAQTKAENQETDKNKDEQQDEEKEKEDEEAPTPVESFHYAVASVDEGFVFQLDIAVLEDQYAITVSKYEGEDPKVKKEREEKEKAEKETQKTGFTRDQASGSFDTFIDNLGTLPKPIAEYTKIFDVGQAYVNGELCYGITVYEKDMNQQNNFVDKYYVSLQSSNIYRYDNKTGKSTLATVPPNVEQAIRTEGLEEQNDKKEKEQDKQNDTENERIN